jgi:dolichol-phosphate mannosyltransferase
MLGVYEQRILDLMAKSDRHRLILIIPAYNEAGKIDNVVNEAKKVRLLEEILVVDDGSKDTTARDAEHAGAKVLSHPRNLGVGAALRTGIDYALEKQFDLIVIMGGDDQDNPSEIHRLVRPITHDVYDFVQGSRYIAGGLTQNIPWFRWITTGFYSYLFKVIIQYPISDGTNGFRAFRTTIFNNKAINIWQLWLNTYELEPYLFYKVIEQGFKVAEAPVTKRYPKGKRGYTKMIPFLDWWRILKPILYLRLNVKK